MNFILNLSWKYFQPTQKLQVFFTLFNRNFNVFALESSTKHFVKNIEHQQLWKNAASFHSWIAMENLCYLVWVENLRKTDYDSHSHRSFRMIYRETLWVKEWNLCHRKEARRMIEEEEPQIGQRKLAYFVSELSAFITTLWTAEKLARNATILIKPASHKTLPYFMSQLSKKKKVVNHIQIPMSHQHQTI